MKIKKKHILECLKDEIPFGWEVFKIQNYPFNGIKIRQHYKKDEIQFNDDGYKYHQLFIELEKTKHYKFLLNKGYNV